MEYKKISKIKSIDYMKLICAFLVVAIHTHPFQDINNLLHYSFSEVLVRIAVPFFFASSGYFYIKNNCNLKKYIKRLFQTYISWSMIYLILQIYDCIKSNGNILILLKSFVIEFFIYGSYYHLWYIVALIICIAITTVFYKFNKMKLLYLLSLILYFIGVIGGAYYKLGSQIPILSSLYNFALYTQIRRYLLMGLPFFMLGYLIFEVKDISKNLNITLIFTAILFVFEIVFVNIFKLQKDIVITLFLYPLVFQLFMLCLKYPINNINNKIDIGKLSSFIYFVHPLIIFILSKFILGETFLYFTTCGVSILIALIFIKINNKKINRLLF